MTKRTNPLDHIRVAAPCPADWERMIGTEQIRFCAQCNLNVYNLSGMTKPEAERLIVQQEGRLCVRFYRRADGTILTKNCPVGWQALQQRLKRRASAVASVILSFFAGIFAFTGLQKTSSTGSYFSHSETTMGTIAITPDSERKTVPEVKGELVEPFGVGPITGKMDFTPEYSVRMKRKKARK